MPGTSWGKARALVRAGKVSVDGRVVTEITHRVPAGARVEVDPKARRPEPDALAQIEIVYLDDSVVVVNKPAGVLTVPFERERDTLVELVRRALRRRPGVRQAELGVVQRLDKSSRARLPRSARSSRRSASTRSSGATSPSCTARSQRRCASRR
jgi:23S rRNA pseudouridine1911/1915/1917 synthase